MFSDKDNIQEFQTKEPSIVNKTPLMDKVLNVLEDNLEDEERLAVLSYFLHNRSEELSENLSLKKIFFSNKKFVKYDLKYPILDEESNSLSAEEPLHSSLFPEFMQVPFPNPQESQFSFIDLFAGIGGIRLPFTELGYKCVFSSEWDKNAQKTYLSNFGEMPFGDICKDFTKKFIPKHFDILLAGFPCQAFSIMGKMKGFEDTRGTLFFEVASILKTHKPRAFLLENVKQLTTHNNGETFKVICDTLKELGYFFKWKVLNALDFGLPQKRDRTIIVGFSEEENCQKFNFDFDKIDYNLKDVLERDEDVDPSLFASEKIIQKRKERTIGKEVFYPSVWHENKSGNISILDYACALRTGASYNYLLINGIRRPSSRELLRFQGFPDNYKIVVPHNEIRKQTGNSVAVPMIREIASKINDILSAKS